MCRPAFAEAEAAVASSTSAPATARTQPFVDYDYSLEAPVDWIYAEMPIPKPGPQRAACQLTMQSGIPCGMQPTFCVHVQACMMKPVLAVPPLRSGAERGPAPERSPLRARFDSADKDAVLSVIVRNAATLKQTLLQVCPPPVVCHTTSVVHSCSG